MAKGRKVPKQTTATDPALEAGRQRWIEQHGGALAKQALEGYRKEGRGIIVMQPADHDPQTNTTTARYISEHGLELSGELARLVQAYDPARHFILVIQHLDSSENTYVMELPQMPTVPSA